MRYDIDPSRETPTSRTTGAAGAADVPVHPAFATMAERAARSTCTILVTGETGVGKGHLANWLHARSERRTGPFVPVNCGAMPESVIDSQLFGHARGAFTGATSDHLGLVRAAEGGTLFLDEVGELPASAQVRLLRLLQDNEVQPVGRSRPVRTDVRVIAASNGDLHEAVERKLFRADLLFRLDVIRIHVPPLRDRPHELEDLLGRFNAEFAALYRQPPIAFAPEALAVLRRFSWPGNIRQLRTLVERLHVLCPGEPIDAGRLHEVGRLEVRPAAMPTTRSLEQIRADELTRVLDASGGSVPHAAAVFGVHRSTIYRWLQQAPRSDGA